MVGGRILNIIVVTTDNTRYLTQFAAARAGLVLVNINPAYQPQELAYCLNKVRRVMVRVIIPSDCRWGCGVWWLPTASRPRTTTS